MSDTGLIWEAIVDVESSGRGFTASGALRTRIELHHLRGGEPPLHFPFFYENGKRNWRGREHMMRTDPVRENSINVHTDDSTEQAALLLAIASYGEQDACYAISMGAGQVVGFNHERCGYKDPWLMYQGLAESEDKQRDAMRAFIDSDRRLKEAIADRDWYRFARYYNGSGQMQAYGDLIRKRLPKHLQGPEYKE